MPKAGAWNIYAAMPRLLDLLCQPHHSNSCTLRASRRHLPIQARCLALAHSHQCGLFCGLDSGYPPFLDINLDQTDLPMLSRCILPRAKMALKRYLPHRQGQLALSRISCTTFIAIFLDLDHGCLWTSLGCYDRFGHTSALASLPDISQYTWYVLSLVASSLVD